MSDKEYMQIAYNEAKKAAELGEVPVGAIIVKDGQVLSVAKNNREETGDATGHAEIVAIREACKMLGGWHLSDCTLYVTLEPCAMCAGAIINARIKRVVYGAPDRRFGAFGSLVDLAKIPFNHIPAVDSGVLEEECSAMLTNYFRRKRSK